MGVDYPGDPFIDFTARRVAAKFSRWVLAASLLLFVITTTLCWQDKSWGALWIAIVVCPPASLGLMLLGLVAAVVLHLRYPEVRYAYLMPSLFACPPLSAGATMAATFMMGLHGG